MKHTVQFKQAAVEQYLQGTQGLQLVAHKHGVEKTMLRRWVLWYQKHGVEGLSGKSGPYDVDFKLSVLQYMWDNALSYTQAAAAFNVRNTQSVADWANRYRNGGVAMLERSRKLSRTTMQAPTSEPTPAAEDDQRPREELLKEIEHLRMEVAYLKKVDALLQARQNSAANKKRKS
jgi:transposase